MESPVRTEVVIETTGPNVTVKSSTADLGTVAAKALELLREACALVPPVKPGPAVGFHNERRHTPPAQPSGMPWAPGPYPVQGEQQ